MKIGYKKVTSYIKRIWTPEGGGGLPHLEDT